jgi:uncharacterized protein (DUF1330 family)
MKYSKRIMLVCTAGALLGIFAVTNVKAQISSPFYVVIEIDEMRDADAFAKAVSAAGPDATLYSGGRLIIRSAKPIALDGAAPPSRLIVVAFDTEEKAKAWRNSPLKN